jgi:hypothetical protein
MRTLFRLDLFLRQISLFYVEERISRFIHVFFGGLLRLSIYLSYRIRKTDGWLVERQAGGGVGFVHDRIAEIYFFDWPETIF